MKELSLNILDIAENSVKAGAKLTQILIDETQTEIVIRIIDNGCGMDEKTLLSVQNPFFTTRTTRSVGMGIPLFRMAAEMAGGEFRITSTKDPQNHGTEVYASFKKNHIDCAPLGDTVASITTLIQGHPDTDFLYTHTKEGNQIGLDTREMRQMLGEEIPLNSYEVIKWAEEC